MKFSIALGTDHVHAPEQFVTGDAIAEIAQAIERSGLHAGFVTDHPAPDAKWLDAGGHHALEPTVALSFAAAATSTLRLHTHIYVLAYRNPFLAAKALGSLDVLSDGRMIVGIGPGYLRAEFRALGMDFDTRVDDTDASVEIMRHVWAGETVAAETERFQARGVRQIPTPRAQPTLWFGGNSRRSMERAIAFGQGWSPFPTPQALASTARTASIASLDVLAAKLTLLHSRIDEVGRTEPLDVCFAPFSRASYDEDPSRTAEIVDELGRMSALGVTWTAVGFDGRDRAEMIDRIERFGAEVASQF